MDSNPEILVGIFTGSGRAFCTGADLRGNLPIFHCSSNSPKFEERNQSEIFLQESVNAPKEQKEILPLTGFCGISTRHGKKPILAAVNGLAVGGGMEVLINCDMVFCSPYSTLSLPDVKVGLTLLGGTLPLLVRKIGRGRATDMVLTGRNVRAEEAFKVCLFRALLPVIA
jgi:enoyl-CoA hydratase/carnithine racemase